MDQSPDATRFQSLDAILDSAGWPTSADDLDFTQNKMASHIAITETFLLEEMAEACAPCIKIL